MSALVVRDEDRFPSKCSFAVETTIAPLESAGTSSFSTLNAYTVNV
ncbi:MAG: hypothetical protein WAN60_07080 [Candidatus Sulfotelmatobacter sp.]